MSNYEWFSCPNLSPKDNLLCSKPIGHVGKCSAKGCQGATFETWDPKETKDFQTPWPITVDESDVHIYGLKLHEYEKHKQTCKELSKNFFCY